MPIRHVTRRGERRLVIDFRYTDSDGGPARYRRDASIHTSASAQKEHDRLYRNAVAYGNPLGPRKQAAPEPKAVPFLELVQHYRKGDLRRVKGTTQDTYNEVIDNLLLPHLGNVAGPEITHAELVRLDAEIRESGLSVARREKALCVVRCVLGSAQRDGLLKELPAFPKVPKVKKNEIEVPSQQETAKVLANASPAAQLAIALALFTGLRAGEIRGLRWTDIDLDRKELTVRRSIARGYEDTPKSGHERRIPLNDEILDRLREAHDKKKRPWDPVCLTGRGKPWGDWGLNQAFKRVCKKAGIRVYTFHCCRHFFITELFRAGVSAIVVQRLAGHADLETTQRYAHYVEQDAREAVERLGVTPGKRPNEVKKSGS